MAGRPTGAAEPLLEVSCEGRVRGEGARCGSVWGTYLHGLFESGPVREALAREAGLAGHALAPVHWRDHLQRVYGGMADLLEEHLNLESLWRYVEG